MTAQAVEGKQSSNLGDYYQPGANPHPADKKTLYCARAFFAAFVLATGTAAGYSFRAVFDPDNPQITCGVLGTLLIGVFLLSCYGLRLSFSKDP